VNRQNKLCCRRRAIESVLKSALAGSVSAADVCVAVTGDEEITELNRKYLGRDCTTDVIAFTYDFKDGRLDGEIIVNAEEALRRAKKTPHSAQDELMLYTVHGLLHLLGWDDATPEDRLRMHRQALHILHATGHQVDARTLLEE
jgi:probable rRNA maturation factor